jgi:5'-3' exonuclease
MNKINSYLLNIKYITKNKFIKDEDFILNKNEYLFYNNINKFDFSDTNINGEGETKIYDYINLLKLKNEKILFFSPDSDVILLSMLSKYSNNIDIIRFNQDDETLSLIYINKLKKGIYSYCSERIEGSDYDNLDIKKLIRDIVFIFTIFGNDFIPRCESIQVNYDFLFIIDMYLINLIDNGYIIIDNNIVNKSLFNYIYLISIHEKRLLFRNAYQNIYHNYNYANQKNFIIDLLNINNAKNTLSNKFSTPFYNLYNNILFYIEPYLIKDELLKRFSNKSKYHGCLEFYLYDKNTLIQIIKNNIDNIPTNDIFNIDISNINKNTPYEFLKYKIFSSKQKKHILLMKDLSERDVELYLINNKLDKYYHIFNPINEFYQDIIKTRKINEIYYYKKYFNNDIKVVVDEYLKGFKWVFQMYFKRNIDKKHQTNIDETWYYPYHKSPLFNSIIKYYNASIINYNIKPIKLNITPLEHLLYVTPIKLSDLSKDNFYSLFYNIDKNKLKKFIEKNIHFFYNLDEIYDNFKKNNKKLFDCSSSVFISKCHYIILNYVVDITLFSNKFNKIYQ